MAKKSSRFLRGVLFLLDDLVYSSDDLYGFKLVDVVESDRLLMLFQGETASVSIWLMARDDKEPAYRRFSKLMVGTSQYVPEANPLLDAVCQKIVARENSLSQTWINAIQELRFPVHVRDTPIRPADVPPARTDRRLMVPLRNIVDIKLLSKAGADVFYAGIRFDDLRNSAPGWNPENCRSSENASVTIVDFERFIEVAHEYGRKIMLTMNSLYPNGIEDQVIEGITRLVDAGVDGIILSDLNLISFVRKTWPNLKVATSVLMNISTPSGMEFLKEIGTNDVVLPRPMLLSEIAELAQGEGPDIEIFIARERCRFINAYCRSEHEFPAEEADKLGSYALCHQRWYSKDSEFTIDDRNKMESCGLCAIAALSRYPRVKTFKIVGRRMSGKQIAPFVQAASDILDRQLDSIEDVQTLITQHPELVCKPEICYYPQDLEKVWTIPPKVIESPKPPIPSNWQNVDRFWLALPYEKPSEPPPEYDGVAIGHETCTHLLPTKTQLRSWLEVLKDKRLIFVLPPLYGIKQHDRVQQLVSELASFNANSQIKFVANDMGTLFGLRKMLGPDAIISIGRLLVKMRDDPRLIRPGAKIDQHSIAFAPAILHLEELAKMLSINRAEISIPNVWPIWNSTVINKLTLHVGPTMLASGRACSYLSRQAKQKHLYIVPETCSRPCLGQDIEIKMAGDDTPFYLVNNALFSSNRPIGEIPAQIDRVIEHHKLQIL